ncbi:MAG: bifunctional [glutamine synthetase] adenylyltransferase/[glutamine synthetase]-adenylyl-L-tyrosine phosphorylase [Alphaproteobacteria bacterium]|nr:bifunctional [glutamine synthetase] adenylyltransferase/[glutamine synthetase]-adenylyl-L-tyrosine phosphorylase [Alphaproteobacteria bacterium]
MEPVLHDAFRRAAWPAPADRDAVPRERERLEAELAGDDPDSAALRGLLAVPEASAALAAVFGNSPFLTNCVLRDAAFAGRLLRDGPESALAFVFATMAAERPLSGAELMRALRVARRRAALAIALADIAGLWDVARVTNCLSDFADRAIGMAVDDQLRQLAESGVIAIADPENPSRGSGLVVLGMGKLGGCELNYSSDVDLIVLYDLARVRAADPDGLQRQFVRLVRGVVKLLEERTGDGYVLRTDLRLRPDPGATPLAMSTDAAEFYYETLGQNWERAAMIKARPVAGDIDAGEAFLLALRPFLWRRNLDFAAVQDIHSIKRQIHAHRGGGQVALAAHNIKVGRGGIREIEFFAQTLQLIWGGRDPSLRLRATCAALDALVKAGHADAGAVRSLTRCYEFLRRAEHRLQMIADQQTQTLPGDEAGLTHLATFLGAPDLDAFARSMLETLRTVERLYAGLFEEAPDLGEQGGNLVFTGTEDDPGTLETLARLGFKDPPAVAAQVRAWHHGRYRCMRSSRARELLTELMPALLGALGRAGDPDAAFLNFDRFMSRLPAGVQLFSLFHANPHLLHFVAEIMGGAPRLADKLSSRGSLLDSVLTASLAADPPDAAAMVGELAAALGQARDFQDVLDIVRRWKSEREFQIGVQLLRGAVPAARAGEALSDIADTALRAMKPAVEAEFRRQHGEIAGAEMAIVALGKLGGREMTATSDLDLLLLYETRDDDAQSDGERKLPAPQYFLRLATRFVNAVTAMTPEGQLYEVDTRLRPSGTKGPIATSLAGFRLYNERDAWTWEHMALTRARVVTASPAMAGRIAGEVRAILTRPRDPERLVGDVSDMRQRIARDRRATGPWDVKNRRGGLVDVEFVAQYLQLRHAATHPEILRTSTAAALRALAEARLLAPADAEDLERAYSLASAVQSVVRIAVDGSFDPAALPAAMLAGLAKAVGAVDFAALAATLDAACARAHAVFDRLIPPEAAAGAAHEAVDGRRDDN